jgi:catechol 2,3-dioxygenase
MTTEPLDARELVRAGGDGSWTGAPRGTTIGHVHLFVGDLAAAERFYHAALGLDKVVWSYPGALFMSAGGYHHHLGTNTWASGAARAEDGDARLLEWELVVPDRGDAEAAARSLGAAGYSTTESDRGWLAADPWGTMVRLIARGD